MRTLIFAVQCVEVVTIFLRARSDYRLNKQIKKFEQQVEKACCMLQSGMDA